MLSTWATLPCATSSARQARSSTPIAICAATRASARSARSRSQAEPRHAAARADQPANERRVGDRRLDPTASVAGWTRHRARGTRADRERTDVVERDDRAAADRDALDGDRWEPAPRDRRAVATRATAGSPSTISETSVLVPPMSKATARSIPLRRASSETAATPAAGPDITVASGRHARRLGWHHATRRTGPRTTGSVDRAGDRLLKPLQVVRVLSWTAAFSAVAAARSYSRASGLTSWDSDTATRPGERVADAPLVLGVGVGVQQAHRHRLDPLAVTQRRKSASCSPSSGRVTAPSAAQRSSQLVGQLGGHDRRQAGPVARGRRDRRALAVRSRSTSANPRVVTRPVRAKSPSRIAFVTCVVPCTTSASPRHAELDDRRARRSGPASRGSLARPQRRSARGDQATMSANVPPVSIPTRHVPGVGSGSRRSRRGPGPWAIVRRNRCERG